MRGAHGAVAQSERRGDPSTILRIYGAGAKNGRRGECFFHLLSDVAMYLYNFRHFSSI